MMLDMRTTLTLEPDVAESLRREISSGKRTLKEVINSCLRKGLGLKRSKPSARYVVRAHESAYLPGIDRLSLNKAYDDLEAVSVGIRR
jgi:hypothetical protein